MTGTPAASASRTATGCPSVRPDAGLRLGCTNRSASASQACTSAGGTSPGRCRSTPAGPRPAPAARAPLIALAQDDQRGSDGRRQPRHRPHQQVVALDGDQPADRQHHRALQAARRRAGGAARRRRPARGCGTGPAAGCWRGRDRPARPGRGPPGAGQPRAGGRADRRWRSTTAARPRPAASGPAPPRRAGARAAPRRPSARGPGAARPRRGAGRRRTASADGTSQWLSTASHRRQRARGCAGSSPPQNRAACSAAAQRGTLQPLGRAVAVEQRRGAGARRTGSAARDGARSGP